MIPSSKIKIVSVSSIICFLLSLYVFGYGLDKYKVDSSDFSISKAVFNGNGITPAIIASGAIGTALLLYLHHLRSFNSNPLIRDVIAIIIFSLFISIIYVTPYNKDGTSSDDEKIQDEHIKIAYAAFTTLFVYNLYTYYILYKNFKTKLPIILAIFNLLVYLALFVPVIILEADMSSKKITMSENQASDLGITFSTFENVNYLSLLLVISLLGFYKN